MNTPKQQFGEFLKELRLAKDLSLREVCRLTGYDPSNWSKIERSRLSPPSNKSTLEKWAKILGLEPAMKQFQEFLDTAMVAQGTIPEDIMSHAKAAKCLPAFFRTMRNEKPTKEEICELVELIKNR